MKIVSAARMRDIDKTTIEGRGIAASALMEAAGRAIAVRFAEDLKERGRAVVLCGRGNNGGDGLIAARHLHHAGWKVEVVVPVDDHRGAAGEARYRLPEPIKVKAWDTITDPVAYLRDFDGAIDALLGIGATGRPRAPIDAMIEALNESAIYVLAADIPSGLDATTGLAEIAVRAARTVTIGLPKLGLVTADGPKHTGHVSVEAIQFPADLLNDPTIRTETMTAAEAHALLPARPHDGHKGTFGLCVVAAGCSDMPGAACIAVEGALRSGCGLVRAWVPGPIRAQVSQHAPEALFPRTPKPANAMLSAVDAAGWKTLLDKTTAIVVGPGIGMDPQSRDFVFQVIEKGHVPTVIDADALNMLAAERDLRGMLDALHVLTPHPGELARLTKRPASEIQADRWAAAADAADRFGCTVLLKGAGTLVASPGGPVVHIATGNTALARGGSGDLLAGLIGGLLAQGMEPAKAAQLGAWVHGLAADIAVREGSPRGFTVRDIAARLPQAFSEIERHPH